jgi:hypothetical protein
MLIENLSGGYIDRIALFGTEMGRFSDSIRRFLVAYYDPEKCRQVLAGCFSSEWP